MTIKLDELRKIAEAAPAGDWETRTSGPWHGDHWYVASGGEHVAMIAAQDGINEEEREPLATHIATFDPPTVLALLSRLDQAERAVARVREAVDDAPTSDPTRGFAGPPDDYPDIGDFIGNGEWSVAERVRRALDGEPNE